MRSWVQMFGVANVGLTCDVGRSISFISATRSVRCSDHGTLMDLPGCVSVAEIDVSQPGNLEHHARTHPRSQTKQRNLEEHAVCFCRWYYGGRSIAFDLTTSRYVRIRKSTVYRLIRRGMNSQQDHWPCGRLRGNRHGKRRQWHHVNFGPRCNTSTRREFFQIRKGGRDGARLGREVFTIERNHNCHRVGHATTKCSRFLMGYDNAGWRWR